jgi:hypothetical protein
MQIWVPIQAEFVRNVPGLRGLWQVELSTRRSHLKGLLHPQKASDDNVNALGQVKE